VRIAAIYFSEYSLKKGDEKNGGAMENRTPDLHVAKEN
jgi:hypothetical protein